MTAIAYITDVEGRWGKIASFVEQNPHVSLVGDQLVVAPGAVLIFGGDAIDRGPEGRKVLRTLLEVRRRQPTQVILLAGNRDINKMRLRRELDGFPPTRTPPEERAAGGAVLMRWIFANTMGAKEAFAHRKTELQSDAGAPCTDEDVVRSFLDDVGPGGLIREYLSVCQLAYRDGPTLFVHGGVTPENFGRVPTGEVVQGAGPTLSDDVATSVDTWVERLNDFYSAQFHAFDNGDMTHEGAPRWAAIVGYQAPLPGTRLNQSSVVYARPTDAIGNPSLPPEALISQLRRDGVDRVVVGHTPSGDTPSLLRHEGFELILADNSYGRLELGSQIHLDGHSTGVAGSTILDDGTREAVRFALATTESSPIGSRDLDSGHLVKGRLSTGDYLIFRWCEGQKVEQQRLAEPDVARRRLGVPW